VTEDSDPYGFVAPPGRRIVPSPPPERSRLLVGVLAGLVAGLVIFGTAGYFIGRAAAPDSAPNRAAPNRGSPTSGARPPAAGSTPGEVPAPATDATPGQSGSLGVFERNQIAINRPAFAGTGLTALAEGWLPYLATCVRSGRPGGPALNAGEKNRVRCTLDGMSAIFVEYKSVADRDRARARVVAQVADARSLTPGVGAVATRATPSGRTEGNYVEYAYRLTERGTTRTISGIWWDDARTPVAGYLLAYWTEGVAESWEPMRDLWSRYA
jgi:hypothetical protein